MAITVATSLDYLIGDLRVHLGDITLPYEYADGLLRHALVMACKTLMHKWRNKYVINASYVVARSTTVPFAIASPPIIQYSDERAFILQASIIIKSANITNTVGSIGSWRDDEIAYSNIASAKVRDTSLDNDIAELELWLRRRLYGGSKQSLAGFKLPENIFEGYE